MRQIRWAKQILFAARKLKSLKFASNIDCAWSFGEKHNKNILATKKNNVGRNGKDDLDSIGEV